MAQAKKNCYVCTLTDAQRVQLEEMLRERGWEFSEAPYAWWKAAGEKVNAVAYQSGKFTVQGAGLEDFVLFVLEPEVLHTFGFGYEAAPEAAAPVVAVTPHGGIDESGKGDFFGPLVIAGCCVDAESGKALAALGVQDSKLIKSDKRIAALAQGIRAALPGRFVEVMLKPATYNPLYRKIGNLNRLLAWGHARVIENLLEQVPDCPRMLSDKFGDENLIRRALMTRGRGIQLDQQVRAESDVAVAAASILARDGFVRGMARLSEELGVTMQRGAGPGVKALAHELFQRHGEEVFESCAKVHFKTWYEVTGHPLPEKPEYSYSRAQGK